jgi:hypothetical protein
MARPQDKTLKNVVQYLEDIGLSVYGPNVDLESGIRFHALRDFNPEEVIKYRKLYEYDNIIDSEELD